MLCQYESQRARVRSKKALSMQQLKPCLEWSTMAYINTYIQIRHCNAPTL